MNFYFLQLFTLHLLLLFQYFSFREDLYVQEDPYSTPVRLTFSGEEVGVSNRYVPFIQTFLTAASPGKVFFITFLIAASPDKVFLF